MKLKKTLASLILSGALACGLAGKAQADVIPEGWQETTTLPVSLSWGPEISLHQDRLLYNERYGNNGANNRLWLYNLTTGENSLLVNNISSGSPDIFGDIWQNKVVWVENEHVKMYDIDTGVISSPLPTTNRLVHSVSIDGNRIISDELVPLGEGRWQYDIFLYDYTNGTETRLTNDLMEQWSPDLYEGMAVWERRPNGQDSQAHMRVCDLETFIIETPLPGFGSQRDPSIFEDNLAFSSSGRIWTYELGNSEPEKLVEAPAAYRPSIYDNRIAWGEYDYGTGLNTIHVAQQIPEPLTLGLLGLGSLALLRRRNGNRD